MKAILVVALREHLDQGRFAELVVWRVPKPVLGSSHPYKYRLAYVNNDECVLRYDNEAGKGDHKHVGGREVPYTFTTIETLLGDFWADVGRSR
ncbi:toxin-antitoxin system TumE family protein [Propylenella binzhouense]|uniref:Uncharacterized protein n=1 Tax=Propylenella binzhouense TaxID=2555902 RepID=A0A964WTJ0_9HYPH|nr:DUF6516 family protein [Propylenella binzhouense]MYZ48036.1 hypothetical protein [Propylenella binzhouense]